MFIIKSAWSRIWHNKKIYLVLMLSIAAGFLCPIYVLGETHYLSELYRKNLFDAESSVYAAQATAPFLEEDIRRTAAASSGADRMDFECFYQTTATWEEDFIAGVGGISDGFFDITPHVLLEGRLFGEEDREQRVCLLKDNSYPAEHGAGVGDSVCILGRDYQIVGIIQTARAYGGILLPYDSMKELTGENRFQHRFLFRAGSAFDPSGLSERLKENRIEDVYSVMSVQEEEQTVILPSYRRNNLGWLAAGISVLILALVSMRNITIGRIMDEKYLYGVRRAVGATGWSLFAEMLVQNGLLVLAAFLLDGLILSLPFERILPYPVDYNGGVWAATALLGALLVLYMSFITGKSINREVCFLLEDRK